MNMEWREMARGPGPVRQGLPFTSHDGLCSRSAAVSTPSVKTCRSVNFPITLRRFKTCGVF